MTKLKHKLNFGALAVALATVIAAPSSAVHADIAGNGGFETAGPGGVFDSAQWNENTTAGAGVSSVRQNGTINEGSWAHELTVVGTDGAGQAAGITQNSFSDAGRPSLQENTSLTAQFDYNADFGPGVVLNWALRVLNTDGAIVGNSVGTISSGTGGSWQTANTGTLTVPAFGAAPDDSYSAFLELNLAAGAFDGSNGTAFIDNVIISGSAVPEPTSAALLGLGCVTMLIRRRR